MAKPKKSNLLESLVPVLLVVSIGLAFLVGIMWQKVANLEGGGATVINQGAGDASAPDGPVNGKLSEDQAGKIVGLKNDDHIRGTKDAKVFLIEYSDLECPFCSSFHPTAKQAIAEYGDDIAWIYRHFPLDTLHPRARPAAQASECVASLGGNDAFWSFVDEIFTDQVSTLTDSGLSTAATNAGVDSGSFSTCVDQEQFASKVEDDYQEGLEAGVTGTPGNFIMNDKGEVWVIPGAVPYDSLKATIDEALAS